MKTHCTRVCFGALALLATVALLALPAGAKSQGEGADETNAAVLSPLAITPIAHPDPVLGSDDKVHVAYELSVVNQSRSSVTLDSVEVLDPATQDTVLATLEGPALASVLNRAVETGTTFAPSTSGDLFVDLQLDPTDKVPKTLLHHFAMTVTSAADPSAAPQSIEFDGVSVPVGTSKAVVVAPPLRGTGWVIGNGCCSPPNAHRGATLSINGTVHVAERFAIDFVQLGANGSLVDGDPTKNESFGYFGDEVYAAAPGKVVSSQDDQPEGTPGQLPPGQTVQTAGGNYLVIDIGHGRYAFYAHMQPGSQKVKIGDTVKTGQPIGLLGNTGNSNAPHLHFHIMDGPSPLLSNGLPFVFTKFTGEGVVTDEQALESLQVAPVDTTASSGTHTKEMPLNREVVGFGK
jgi:hypothetical protein